MTRERFVIELEALEDDVPARIRLRMALKRLLRTHRLRCLSVRPRGDAMACDHDLRHLCVFSFPERAVCDYCPSCGLLERVPWLKWPPLALLPDYGPAPLPGTPTPTQIAHDEPEPPGAKG